MGFAAVQEVRMTTNECYKCGVIFAMPTSLDNHALKSGAAFYCPNGHGQAYTENEADRLRKKLDEQTRIATQQSERAALAERESKKAKATLATLKKRIKNKARTWKPPITPELEIDHGNNDR
jgi:hypothetical protein